MLDAAEQASELASGATPAALETDRRRRDALLWNFTVLGEAAGQVTDELKSRHPHIPWAQPSRLRNRIVHGYWSVDLDLLIVTAERDLPSFCSALRRVLDAEGLAAESPGEGSA